MAQASAYCKSSGLKSLAEVAKLTKQSVQTLHNWHKNKPELFHAVVVGCAKIKELERAG